MRPKSTQVGKEPLGERRPEGRDVAQYGKSINRLILADLERPSWISPKECNAAAVFRGHSHNIDLRDLGSIHYCTLVAAVEGTGAVSSGYSALEFIRDRTLRPKGFRKELAYY